jgi:hypothetical protein
MISETATDNSMKLSGIIDLSILEDISELSCVGITSGRHRKQV